MAPSPLRTRAAGPEMRLYKFMFTKWRGVHRDQCVS